MANIISPTGFWIEHEEKEHSFIPELSKQINQFINIKQHKKVYDFGCGKGDYLQKIVEEFSDIEAVGFEGHITSGSYANIKKQDLSVPIDMPKADMVISIEVGEHIPKEFEQTFIDNICKSARKHIVLSWAIVGQTGNGHINCQNNDYVIDQMQGRGWVFDKRITNLFRKNMPNTYIKNTLMVFNK